MYEYVCKLDKWADKRVTQCDVLRASKISNFFPIALRSPKYQTPTSVSFFFLGNVILRSRHFCSSNSNVITNVSSGKRANGKRRKRVFPKKWSTRQVRNFFRYCLPLSFFPLLQEFEISIFILHYKEKKERRGKR